MRVQLIYDEDKLTTANHLMWLFELLNLWSSKYGVEPLEIFHNGSIDYSNDVIFKVFNSSKVQIGFLNEVNYTQNIGCQFHWVQIESFQEGSINLLTQLILVTIGMQYLISVTGGFSSDWTDIKTVLSRGDKGYCCMIEWDDSEKVIGQINSIKYLSPLMNVLGCSILLNQELPIRECFNKVEKILKRIPRSDDLLSLVNIINLKELPSTNILLLVSSEFSSEQTKQLIWH